MERSKVIYWLRQDLRLNDNPAFLAALKSGVVLVLYIVDSEEAEEYRMGGASKAWLHHSLESLNKSLGNKLSLYRGVAQEILEKLCIEYGIKKIFWNRCYEPWRMQRDSKLKIELQKLGVEATSYNASLLWESWHIKKKDGTPYQVFTPFYKNGCLKAEHPRLPLKLEIGDISSQLIFDKKFSLKLEQLQLLPEQNWHISMMSHWKTGEIPAMERLEEFFASSINQYKEGRNLLGRDFVSKLSPYLHFGEISPHQIWWRVAEFLGDVNVDHFCSELGWREFSYNLLYFNHDLPKKNLQTKFDNFPWKDNNEHLFAWKKGVTGIPIVDAGMRELWQTGYMHNRARMVVASFLVKNLMIDWRHGERWFWDCLVDADLANNSASWQWVAGCGADAAPYFRIFNPITQGEKFDPNAEYIKKYVPELKQLPKKYIFSPWLAPSYILQNAGIKLGIDYPHPIVDLGRSRKEALEAFSSL